MNTYSLSHLGDATLLRDLAALVSRDRVHTALLLAHVAEVDARKLFRGLGYSSMFRYCVGELRLSEHAAYCRVTVARVARRMPVIFEAIADGRVHLCSVTRLAPYLTPDNVDELLAAATHKTKDEVLALIAQRYPRADVATVLRALPVDSGETGPSKPVPSGGVSTSATDGPVALLERGTSSGDVQPMTCKLGLDRVLLSESEQLSPPPAAAMSFTTPATPPKLTPLAPKRYALQVTLSQETHDKIRHAQQLLVNAIAPGDVAAVLDRALDLLVAQLERRKHGAVTRPARKRRPTRAERHIPAHIKREVWQRDGGRCTFVGEREHRCESRVVEFDHVLEHARGGKATVANLRLRCRAHNQLEAERTFGVGFMRMKREARGDLGGQGHACGNGHGRDNGNGLVREYASVIGLAACSCHRDGRGYDRAP